MGVKNETGQFSNCPVSNCRKTQREVRGKLEGENPFDKNNIQFEDMCIELDTFIGVEIMFFKSAKKQFFVSFRARSGTGDLRGNHSVSPVYFYT